MNLEKAQNRHWDLSGSVPAYGDMRCKSKEHHGVIMLHQERQSKMRKFPLPAGRSGWHVGGSGKGTPRNGCSIMSVCQDI